MHGIVKLLPNSTSEVYRRHFQFGLRTLFIAVTIVAVWLGWELKFICARAAIAKDPAVGAMPTVVVGERTNEATINRSICITNELPWWRRLLGDQSYCVVFVGEGADAAKSHLMRRLFPEAEVKAAESPFIHPVWQPLVE
jgi:hypothetical protein